eukprot:scaffold179027_cov30-Tisochrysis_lutea.AAC.2
MSSGRNKGSLIYHDRLTRFAGSLSGAIHKTCRRMVCHLVPVITHSEGGRIGREGAPRHGNKKVSSQSGSSRSIP